MQRQPAVGEIFKVGTVEFVMTKQGRRHKCLTPGCNSKKENATGMCSKHSNNANKKNAWHSNTAEKVNDRKEIRDTGIAYQFDGTQWRKCCIHEDCIERLAKDSLYCHRHCAGAPAALAAQQPVNIVPAAQPATVPAVVAPDDVPACQRNFCYNWRNDPMYKDGGPLTPILEMSPPEIPIIKERAKRKPKDMRNDGQTIYVDNNRRYIVRDKIVNGAARATRFYYCTGKDNTCMSQAKIDVLCTLCAVGQVGVGKIREEMRYSPEGLVVVCSDGRRRCKSHGQTRSMCMGDNDTCLNFAKNGGATAMCTAHHNNKFPNAKGAKKGDTRGQGENRRIFNGKQFVKLCKHNTDGVYCEVTVTVGGFCKKHAVQYHCKYTNDSGSYCEKIKVTGTDYCKCHANGIVNKREMWRMEAAIIDILESNNIKYVHGYYVKSPDHDRTFVYDFYLPDHNTVIEADGKQHFMAIEFWGGEDGLAERKIIDEQKDEWALTNGYCMVRVHWKDQAYIRNYIMGAIKRTVVAIEPFIYLSQSYGHRNNVTVMYPPPDDIAFDDSQYKADEPVDEDE